MSIKAIYYGANGWLVELDNTRILIDPWLNGDLTFPPGDWLIKGKLSIEIEVPRDIDFLLLPQGQPDHAHPPTLGKLDQSCWQNRVYQDKHNQARRILYK